MSKLENLDIRLKISDLGITYKDFASYIGIRPDSLCRLLSKPLSKKKRDMILNALRCIGGVNMENGNKTKEVQSCIYCCDEDEDKHINIDDLPFEPVAFQLGEEGGQWGDCMTVSGDLEIRLKDRVSIGVWNHEISLCFGDGTTVATPIRYCPMCGRKF